MADYMTALSELRFKRDQYRNALQGHKNQISAGDEQAKRGRDGLAADTAKIDSIEAAISALETAQSTGVVPNIKSIVGDVKSGIGFNAKLNVMEEF